MLTDCRLFVVVHYEGVRNTDRWSVVTFHPDHLASTTSPWLAAEAWLNYGCGWRRGRWWRGHWPSDLHRKPLSLSFHYLDHRNFSRHKLKTQKQAKQTKYTTTTWLTSLWRWIWITTFSQNLRRVIRQHWLTEQGLTSHQTHYRSYWGWVITGSNDQTNSVKALKEDRS